MVSSDPELDELIKFRLRLGKSGGFDVEHLLKNKPTSYALSVYDDGDYSDEILVYAKIGIHRYDMAHGTNLQLSVVEKYNTRPNTVYESCYITLVAKDLDSGGSLVPFQTQVVVELFDIKTLSCNIAKPKFQPEEEKPPVNKKPVKKEVDNFIFPKWPSSFHDENRYYLVKKSELLKYDWIRLYMELAFLKENTKIKKPKLSRLAIVKVAVETDDEYVEQPNERLKARNATFYIKYKYKGRKKGRNKGRICKVHHVCKPPRYGFAIVRRTISKTTGLLRLMFENCFV